MTMNWTTKVHSVCCVDKKKQCRQEKKTAKSFTVGKCFHILRHNNNNHNGNNQHSSGYRSKVENHKDHTPTKSSVKERRRHRKHEKKESVSKRQTNDRKRKIWLFVRMCAGIYLSIFGSVFGMIMWPPNRRDSKCMFHAPFIYFALFSHSLSAFLFIFAFSTFCYLSDIDRSKG